MSKASTVFLDLDGTLIDPKPGILGSIQYAMRQMGETPPRSDDLTWAIGPPLRKTFATLLGEARAEAAVAHYRHSYANGAMYDCDLYPDIAVVLETLVQRGHRLVVVTAKAHAFARPIVAHVGLGGLVSAVYGPELDGTRDNKADLLAHVLEVERADPAAAVMVGDRQFDIVAANANAVPAIGVTWGYGTAEELTEAGARQLCHTPRDLISAVR